MIVLGIDPGLAHTGWGIVENRGTVLRTHAYGCIETTTTQSLMERLSCIASTLVEVVKKYEPAAVAIEEVFFGQNTKSAIATAHARGAALVACASLSKDLGEYTPMQIKQAVVGTGSAEKQQVIYMVRRILELDHDPKPDHCADALAVAICHINSTETLKIAASDKAHARGLSCAARCAV